MATALGGMQLASCVSSIRSWCEDLLGCNRYDGWPTLHLDIISIWLLVDSASGKVVVENTRFVIRVPCDR